MLADVILKCPFRISLCDSGLIQQDRYGSVVLFPGFILSIFQFVHCGDGFSDFPGYKSSNPVVSDDGRFVAFQMAKSKDPAGVGYGIFIYDFDRARRSK